MYNCAPKHILGYTASWQIIWENWRSDSQQMTGQIFQSQHSQSWYNSSHCNKWLCKTKWLNILKPFMNSCRLIFKGNSEDKKAGSELGQAQVKLDDIVEVVVDVVVIAVVQVEV